MHILSGCRVGWWKPGLRNKEPFRCLGHYTGPDIWDCIVGKELSQKLMEGELKFTVGVLFRPDLGKKQRLETILILKNYFEEMWDYDTWEQVNEVGNIEAS